MRRISKAPSRLLTPILLASASVVVLLLCLMPILRPFMPLLTQVPFYEPRAGMLSPAPTQRNLMEAGITVSEFESKENSRTVLTLSDIGTLPSFGDIVGTILVAGTDINCDVYYGDGTRELHYGAALHTEGTVLPGQAGTVMMGGHTGTHFNDMANVHLGALIHLDTYYGKFVYEVTDLQVVDYQDPEAFLINGIEEVLVLYTCYPFDTLGFTPTRYCVYANPVSGPILQLDEVG